MPGRFPDRPAPDELAALFAAEDLARLRSRRAEYPKRHRHAAGPSTQETPPADETGPAAPEFQGAPDRPQFRTLTHVDRTGAAWRFGVVCTRRELDALRDILAGIGRRRPGAARLSLSALIADSDGEKLFTDFEAAMLHGLAQSFPNRPPTPPRLQDPPPPPPREDPAPQLCSPAPDVEGAGRYWWDDM